MTTSSRASSPTIAIIGLGGLGSASAWFAAKSGAQVIGFEQFELGHVRGASHDHSRIIRHSYHTAEYVRLTVGAYDAWAEVEAASGSPIITTTGGIDLFPPGAAIDPATYLDSMRAARVDHEWIDGHEIRNRWPAFTVDDDVMGIVQDETGIVPAGRATATLQQLARDAGARFHPNCRVLDVRPSGSGVEITTESGRHSADVAIITTDAWTTTLLRTVGIELPLEVTLEQVTYLRHPSIEHLQIGRLPVWIWMDDPSYYGFPEYGHPGTIKVAEDCGGSPVDPDTRPFDPDPSAESRLLRFTEGLLGGGATVDHSVTCLYTLTSDRDFVLDRLPGTPQILVGMGAAHGFKFAAWFGRTLAALALDETIVDDLSTFALDRATLFEPVDRTRWLV